MIARQCILFIPFFENDTSLSVKSLTTAIRQYLWTINIDMTRNIIYFHCVCDSTHSIHDTKKMAMQTKPMQKQNMKTNAKYKLKSWIYINRKMHEILSSSFLHDSPQYFVIFHIQSIFDFGERNRIRGLFIRSVLYKHFNANC